MNNLNQDGPTRINIPSRIELSCKSCNYCIWTMIKSGFNPVFRYDCTHKESPKSPMKLSFTGNLPDDASTPEWCPFLKNKKGSIKTVQFRNTIPINSIQDFNYVGEDLLNNFMESLLKDKRYSTKQGALNFNGIALFSNYQSRLTLLAGKIFSKEEINKSNELRLEATNYLIEDNY